MTSLQCFGGQATMAQRTAAASELITSKKLIDKELSAGWRVTPTETDSYQRLSSAQSKSTRPPTLLPIMPLSSAAGSSVSSRSKSSRSGRKTSSHKSSGRLPQSVLPKAFHSELVPTGAEFARRERRSFETAEQLLTRTKKQQTSPVAVCLGSQNGVRRHARR